MLLKFVTLLLFASAQSDLSHIEDLTWDFDNTTIYYPEATAFTYTKVVVQNKTDYWISMKEFCVAEHGGTHFDAPVHFNIEGWKVADVPITRLLARGATIDLSHRDSLQVQDLENWVRDNGPFEDNTVLLVNFGRSKLWPNRTAYLSIDENGKYHFPGFSSEAATWIVNSKKIVGVGVDTPSVDPGNTTDFMAHRILSQSQIYNVENVKLLVDLPAKGFNVVVSPIKMKEGTGGPVRIFAVPKGFW